MSRWKAKNNCLLDSGTILPSEIHISMSTMNVMTQEGIRSSVNTTVHERNVATCLCVTGELYNMVPTVSVVEEAPCLSDS